MKYKYENKKEGKIPKVLLSSGRLCLISVGVSGPARRGGPSLSEAGTGTTQSLSSPDTSCHLLQPPAPWTCVEIAPYKSPV